MNRVSSPALDRLPLLRLPRRLLAGPLAVLSITLLVPLVILFG
ncbi:MAG: hypothetical protein DIU62_000900 [Pseudomonadota bacterium]|jgi:hypothetical protein